MMLKELQKYLEQN